MLPGLPSRSKTAPLLAALILLFFGAHLLYSSDTASTWRFTTDNEAANHVGIDNEASSPIALNPVLEHGDLQDEKASLPTTPAAPEPEQEPPNDTALPCQRLPGAEDVVVIMRTGATEIQDKLPMHFNTTFRCYRDTLIFSDYEEVFQGHQVHDVLRSMDETVKRENNDFELYRRLLQYGRSSLREDELSGTASFEGSKSGKGDNPGWKLDKWKFLPMMNETLQLRPDKKWYIFVESDSYPVWSNILQWLERLDPSKPHYYGSEVQIGPDIFAHGGSVFVLSKSGIEK